MALGTDFDFRYGTEIVNHGAQSYTSVIPAGGYYAVMIAGGSVSPARLEAVKGKLEATKSVLAGQDAALIGGLTRDDLLGDMFYSGTLGYTAEYLGLSDLAGLQQKAIEEVAPSVGVYGYKPKVARSFGFPRSISTGGIEMDLPGHKAFNAKLNGDRSQLISFRFQVGLLSSALEHGIPEQMFVTPENPGEAVSAVKALAKAAQEGQRIYHITQANVAAVMPNIHIDGSAKSEIEAAVAVGKEATVHTDPISVPGGWSGAGYVIFDSVSGDGAYKIVGGQNGSYWTGYFLGSALSYMAIFFAAATAGAGLLAAVAAVAFGITLFAGIMFWIKTWDQTDFDYKCLLTGFAHGLALVGMAGGAFNNFVTGMISTVAALVGIGDAAFDVLGGREGCTAK